MTAVRDRCHQAPLAGRHSHTGTYHGRHKAHGHRVLSSATPSVLGDFTHHFIRNEGAVAKFSFGRLGSRPPPPVGQGPATATAPAGPERHWRKRRGPSAGDGLGNRGAIRASSRFTDREHGGTQIVSRRPGSPREPRSEGPRVLLEHLIELLLSDSTIRGGIFNAGDENPHRHPGGQPPSLDELALAPDLLIRGGYWNGEVRKGGTRPWDHRIKSASARGCIVAWTVAT